MTSVVRIGAAMHDSNEMIENAAFASSFPAIAFIGTPGSPVQWVIITMVLETSRLKLMRYHNLQKML
jgi:hypothetical protein